MTISSDDTAPRRIVFLDRETLPQAVTVRKPVFPHDWREHPRTTPGDVVARAQGAEIVITNKVPLRADALAQLPGLKLIARSEEHTSELQSLMRISYAVFRLKKNNKQ